MKQLIILLLLLSSLISKAQTPVAANGKLKLIGNQLCNSKGYPVQLRGLSSHGLQWYGGCLTEASIGALQKDWNADIVRLAMYVDEGGYMTDSSGYRKRVMQLVDWAISAGVYVIVDWHILTPGNPLVHTADAKKFFHSFSYKYKNVPNVLYEICNEPNGGTDAEWSEWIRPYAIEVIPVIRANNPDAIILVGTPKWSSKVGDVYANPLPADLAKNCLYSFHFYGGSHFTQAYISEYSDKLPIFATEWGTSNYSGNGGNNYINSQDWLDLFAGKNNGAQLISWCNWSFSDKSETSAALINCNAPFTSRTESGDFVWKNLHSPARNYITSTPTTPVIVVQPFAALVTKGTPTQLRVKAVGGGLSYQWYLKGKAVTSAIDSILTINSVQPADTGLYYVIVSNTFGQTQSRSVQLEFDDQTPNSGVPQTIAGVLEFEKYDTGGEGLAYHDLNAGGVSIDAGVTIGSKAVVSIGDNEWIEYTVSISKTGFYKIDYILKTEEYFPKLYWALDGNQISSIYNVPNTKYVWDTISDPDTVRLTEGTHVLRIIFENGGKLYLDKATFTLLNIDCHGDNNGTASIDGCGICSGGKTGITPAIDTDGDGVYDCKDLCPNDKNKTIPGVCGCGVVDGTCPDCAGVIGGTASIDQCGVCSGGTTGKIANASCKDCSGMIKGTASIDQCGICSGGTTGLIANASCTDCAGILHGTATVDQCGVCSGGTTGKIANASCSDCKGVPNGTSVIDACGICAGDGSSCQGTLTPYKGIRRVIPGRIEFEDYDAGGENVAYHEIYSPTNEGEDYRPNEAVDIDALPNGSGYSLGWVADGEWIKFSVSIKYDGFYTLKVRNGSPNSGLKFAFLLNGKTWSGDLTAINTGSYEKFDTLLVTGLALKKGIDTITVKFMAGGINFDWFEVLPEFKIDCNGEKNGLAVLDNCGRCVEGTTGLTACATQTIALNAGWNLVSFNTLPDDTSPSAVFASVLSELEVVKDNEVFYNPNQATMFNLLTKISSYKSYYVKMLVSKSMTVNGSAVPETLPTFSTGWNLLACPYHKPKAIKEAFSGQSIEVIKNFDGFWMPNNSQNSLDSLRPGNGYLLKK